MNSEYGFKKHLNSFLYNTIYAVDRLLLHYLWSSAYGGIQMFYYYYYYMPSGTIIVIGWKTATMNY